MYRSVLIPKERPNDEKTLGGSDPQTPRYPSASGLCMETYAKVSKKNDFFKICRPLAMRQPRSPQGHAQGRAQYFKKTVFSKISRPEAMGQRRRRALRAEPNLFLDGMHAKAC